MNRRSTARRRSFDSGTARKLPSISYRTRIDVLFVYQYRSTLDYRSIPYTTLHTIPLNQRVAKTSGRVSQRNPPTATRITNMHHLRIFDASRVVMDLGICQPKDPGHSGTFWPNHNPPPRTMATPQRCCILGTTRDATPSPIYSPCFAVDHHERLIESCRKFGKRVLR